MEEKTPLNGQNPHVYHSDLPKDAKQVYKGTEWQCYLSNSRLSFIVEHDLHTLYFDKQDLAEIVSRLTRDNSSVQFMRYFRMLRRGNKGITICYSPDMHKVQFSKRYLEKIILNLNQPQPIQPI